MRGEGEGRKGNETPVPDWESEKVATLRPGAENSSVIAYDQVRKIRRL